jgi:hypothetical protein
MEKSYIVIPIYSDPFLHPLHRNNKLSLLYTREIDLKEGILHKGEFIPQLHPDCSEMLQDYSEISEGKGIIFTLDSKKLQPIFSTHKKILCLNQCHWWLKSKPYDLNLRNNAIEFLSNKYYNVKKLNEIVPISKHKEYCDELSEEMFEWLQPKVNDLINDEGWFVKDGSTETIEAFSEIEKNGIKVSDDVCDIFDMRVKKHISNGKLYSNYNLWTTTGRPSNSFGTVNFAALTKEQRKAFVPENNSLVEFDFDAYHLRLIGNLVGFNFPTDISVHEYFAKKYDCSYEESKQRTFQILYGGIREEHKKLSGFFDLTYDYINKKWNEINRYNYIFTDIYRRKLLFENYDDLNRNKLFNYLIQGYETEMNIKKILSIQYYLSTRSKKTKLVLYGYDSFLFDFSEQDGVKTLKEIKKILEDDCDLPTNRMDYKPYFKTKSKMGLNYGEMKDITKRL